MPGIDMDILHDSKTRMGNKHYRRLLPTLDISTTYVLDFLRGH